MNKLAHCAIVSCAALCACAALLALDHLWTDLMIDVGWMASSQPVRLWVIIMPVWWGAAILYTLVHDAAKMSRRQLCHCASVSFTTLCFFGGLLLLDYAGTRIEKIVGLNFWLYSWDMELLVMGAAGWWLQSIAYILSRRNRAPTRRCTCFFIIALAYTLAYMTGRFLDRVLIWIF